MKFVCVLLIVLAVSPAVNSGECISHRANVGSAPENSLEGLKLALAMNVSGVELDIQVSRDGVPFLYHNDKLGDGLVGKTCPQGQKIEKLNFLEIQNKCFLTNGENLPLLSEALDVLSSYEGHFFVDLKQKASREFYQTLEQGSLWQRPKLRFLSFKKRILRPLRERWPDAKTILLSRYIPRGPFYEGAGLNSRLRFFTLRPQRAQSQRTSVFARVKKSEKFT